MIVTFHRNRTKFYSANIPQFHGFQNCFPRSGFGHTLKSYRTPSEEGLLTEETGHCKYRVCSPLWSWGKQQPGSSGSLVPCWGLCIWASATGEWVGKVWEEWVWSRRFLLLFIAKNSHPKANLLPCQNVFSKIGLQQQLLCSCKRSSEACSSRSCLLQLQKPSQSLGMKDTLPHAAHWQGAPALSQEEKWGM